MLKYETWNFARDCSGYSFIDFFLHNLCALNSNIWENILYLMTLIFKLTKHKMTTKMVRKPHICYDLAHIKRWISGLGINVTDDLIWKTNSKWPRNSPSYEQETKWISKCKSNLFFIFVSRNCSIYSFCMTLEPKQTFLMFIVHRLTYSLSLNPRWTSFYIFTIKIMTSF